jgi:hypothetical protein
MAINAEAYDVARELINSGTSRRLHAGSEQQRLTRQ